MNDMAVEYKRRLFTVAEYHRLAEAGVLGENDGVELIDGELIEMPPIGPQHVSLHARITHYLNDTLRERATVLPMGSLSPWRPKRTTARYRRLSLRSRYVCATSLSAPKRVRCVHRNRDLVIRLRFRREDAAVRDARHPSTFSSTCGEIGCSREPGPAGYATLREYGYGDVFSVALVPEVELAADAFLDIRD